MLCNGGCGSTRGCRRHDHGLGRRVSGLWCSMRALRIHLLGGLVQLRLVCLWCRLKGKWGVLNSALSMLGPGCCTCRTACAWHTCESSNGMTRDLVSACLASRACSRPSYQLPAPRVRVQTPFKRHGMPAPCLLMRLQQAGQRRRGAMQTIRGPSPPTSQRAARIAAH